MVFDEGLDVFFGEVVQEVSEFGIINEDFMQIVLDLKEFFSLILCGIKEVQFVVGFVGIMKKIDVICFVFNLFFFNVVMKEVGIDLYCFDLKLLLYCMYFFFKDIVYEVFVVVLFIFIGLDDGDGKLECLVYILMVIIIVWIMLLLKIVEFVQEGNV